MTQPGSLPTSTPATPPPAAAPAAPAASGAGVPPAQGAAVVGAGKRFDTRNVIILTLCGVVVVLALLLVSYFMHNYEQAKRDLNSEMHAPEYQTSPEKIQMSYGEWYLKRAREAFDRRDMSACRMMLDDLTDMLKKNKNALSPESQLQLKDLVEDFNNAAGPGQP